MSVSYSRPSLWRERSEAWKEVMPGVKRRILSHSTTGLMVLYKIERGRTFAMHNHPHAQYGVFLQGEGKFQVGDTVWEMKSGDTYFIPPGVLHELKTEKECMILDFFTPEREDYAQEALPPDVSK
jgi:quercetin dioxygenase-like cupin family protein